MTLSGNIHLKKGASTFVQSTLRDPTIYENPDVYDGYRFYRMRQQPGKENVSIFASAITKDTDIP